jgi:hypothetical protein
MLTRAIAIFTDHVRSLFRPPSTDTDAELAEVERAIDEEAEPDLPPSVLLARSLVDTGEYCLGAGRFREGRPPWTRCAKPGVHRHRHAKTALIFADCSGFLTAMWGIPRQLPDGTWLNTDVLERLAMRFFVPWDEVRPGDGVVYGAGAKIGHCGLYESALSVIHCSASGSVAVKRNAPEWWQAKGALVIRPELAGLT